MDTIYDFTEEERLKINEIHKRNFENMTPEEVQLFARYTAAVALANDAYQREQQRQEELIQAQIQQSQAMTDAALERMHALRDVALAKLQAVKNGQEEQS